MADIDAEALRKNMRVLKTIWGALLFSLALYLFIGQYMIDKSVVSRSDTFPLEQLRIALYGMSIVLVASIRYWRTFILSREVKVSSGTLSRSLRHPEIGKYTTAMIVSLSLADSVGIYGLVLAILRKSRFDLYVLICIAAATMYYYRPKEEEIIAFIRQKKHRPDM